MRISIIDCYTDEPSGLGVMPYVGTYPRYIFGALLKLGIEPFYLTIDDIRSANRAFDIENDIKTNIRLRNTTPNNPRVGEILTSSDIIIVIAGVHTPGKYLSAYPGTTVEVKKLLLDFHVETKFLILTGPSATIGSGLYGGRKARSVEKDSDFFDLTIPELEYCLEGLLESNFQEVREVEDKYEMLREIAPHGARIAPQLPHDLGFHIIELETMSGCAKKIPCSFCMEGLNEGGVRSRPPEDIIDEVRALNSQGFENFRLGKQTCIYSYGNREKLERLLSGVSQYSKILHIDNANPLYVDEGKTRALVKYCSPGNVASMGVESFDGNVILENDLMTSPELVYEAVKTINDIGGRRGLNGMPAMLPGINLLFGLKGERKSSHEENMHWLRKIYDDGLMLRRINIREVVLFHGTKLSESVGNKFLRKNRRYYWRWRDDIRKNIDNPMLERILPLGTVVKGLRTEIYDGNTTFARQIGSYPLVVGIKGRIGLDRSVDASVIGHMLRSIVGEEVGPPHSMLNDSPHILL